MCKYYFIFTFIINCQFMLNRVLQKQVFKHFELLEDSNSELVDSLIQHSIKVMQLKLCQFFQRHFICIKEAPLPEYRILRVKSQLYCEYLVVVIHYSRFMFLKVFLIFCYHPLIIYILMLFLKCFLCLIYSFSSTQLILMMSFLFNFNQYLDLI